MALRKMEDPSINLKENDGEELDEKLLHSKDEHRKHFEERIKRIEASEKNSQQEEVRPTETINPINKEEKVVHEQSTEKAEGSGEMLNASTETSVEKEPGDRSEDAEKAATPVENITSVIETGKEKKDITKEKKSMSGTGTECAKEESPKQASEVLPTKQATEDKNNLQPNLSNISQVPNSTRKITFPEGFLWGVSTSAYQIEGGNENDWSIWEKEGRRMLKVMERTKNPEEFICGQACDSYNRYEEDFDLALELNNNSFRLGIEWSRVEKNKGIWNVDEIKHYRNVLRAAKKRGLTTVVTLWHWTLPSWLAREGGLISKQLEEKFMRYVEMVIGELGGDIDYWVTLNEPMIAALNAYISKRWPPNKKSILKYRKAIKNLAKVHKASYKMIHDRFPDARVGFSNLTNFIEPKHKWLITDRIVAAIFESMWNKWFINKTIDQVDYIGMSYYFHDRVISYPPFVKNDNNETTDMGWEIYPAGIYHVLKQLAKYKKPIMIIENGIADAEDKHRSKFIKDHLENVHKAILEGVEVIGYFHWSLLDNFEWDSGYGPKFGLYKVDRKTFERTPRPSAAVYAQICKENAVEI